MTDEDGAALAEQMLPCPNCGEKDVDPSYARSADGQFNAGCMVCGMSGPDSNTMRDAVDRWNALPRNHASPAQEPVAWRFRYWMKEFDRWSEWTLTNSELDYYGTSMKFEVVPLYASPAPLDVRLWRNESTLAVPARHPVLCFWYGINGGKDAYAVAMHDDGEWHDPDDPDNVYRDPDNWTELPPRPGTDIQSERQ